MATPPNLGVLEQRVGALETQVQQWMQSTTNQISSLANKIDERSRVQWPLWVGLGSILLAAMTYLDAAKLGPLKERDAEIVSLIKDMQADMKANVVPAPTHEIERRYRDNQISSLEGRAKIIEDNTSQRIKRLEDAFNQTYSIRDAMQDFNKRIDRIEQALPTKN